MHSLNVGGGDKGIDTVNFQSVFANGFVLPALKGLQLSNHTDAAHDIQITSGLCSDDANSEHMHLGSLIVKQIDAAWAVGTNQGGLDGSESVPGTPDANTWYHLHVIKRTDTGIVDVLFSESATAPTLPTNYTKSRRVGSVLTDGSANILGFSQVGDDFLWDVPVNDYNAASTGTAAVLRVLTVPTGVQVWANHTYSVVDLSTGTAGLFLLTSPDQTDTAPSATVHDISIVTGGTVDGGFVNKLVRTNTSAQIRTRASNSQADLTNAGITFGWMDRRGRDA